MYFYLLFWGILLFFFRVQQKCVPYFPAYPHIFDKSTGNILLGRKVKVMTTIKQISVYKTFKERYDIKIQGVAK